MNYIKRIYNDSKELTDKYIIIGLISAVLIIVNYIAWGYTLTDLWLWQDFIVFDLPNILLVSYFIYIKTTKGKQHFNMLNKIISVIFIIMSVLRVLALADLYSYVSSISFWTCFSILESLLPILFYVYWIVVFFLKDRTKNKIFKGNFNNSICGWLITINIIFFVVRFCFICTNISEYGVIEVLNNILLAIIQIMQIRYVALYRNFKEGK